MFQQVNGLVEPYGLINVGDREEHKHCEVGDFAELAKENGQEINKLTTKYLLSCNC